MLLNYQFYLHIFLQGELSNATQKEKNASLSAEVADWNPFDQATFQKESDSFGAEFDMIRQDDVVKSKENLVMTEDVFSSAPFSLPGKLS